MAITLFDSTKPLTRHNDYTETVIQLKPEELVIMNHLKRAYPGFGSVGAWKRTNELAGKQKKNYSAVAEGTDKTGGFSMRENQLVESMIEVGHSNGYAITREALKLNKAHIKSNLLDTLIDQDADDFARSIEHVIGSRQECVDRGTSTTITKTRGLMCWLQPGAHNVLPIADGFRPFGELQIAADGTLTEEAFKNALIAARKHAGHSLNLTGFVGMDAKIAFADFLAKIDTTSSLRRAVDYKAKEIFSQIDFLRYDAGMVTLVPCDGLDCDTSTLEPTTTSGMSGAFIELDNFQLEFAEPITHEDLSTKTDKGSGKKGWHHAMFRLNCTGLLGSFRMIKAAAAS